MAACSRDSHPTGGCDPWSLPAGVKPAGTRPSISRPGSLRAPCVPVESPWGSLLAELQPGLVGEARGRGRPRSGCCRRGPLTRAAVAPPDTLSLGGEPACRPRRAKGQCARASIELRRSRVTLFILSTRADAASLSGANEKKKKLVDSSVIGVRKTRN